MVILVETEPYGIAAVNTINDLLNTNKDIIGFLKQKAQHEAALKEIKIILKEIKNKKIKFVEFPTVGGLHIKVPSSDPRITKRLEEMEKQTDNAIKGIEGQMIHRKDMLNEFTLKTFRFINAYANTEGLKLVVKDGKRDEVPKQYDGTGEKKDKN